MSYLVDGENRRLARALNGTTTSEYLYKNALNVVAQLDGSGNLVTRYVFGSKPNVPDYLVDTNGNKYRVLSDHLGSPRLVVNAATGVVAEEIRLRRVRRRDERHEAGVHGVRVRGRALRCGDGAREVRGEGLRRGRGEVDE